MPLNEKQIEIGGYSNEEWIKRLMGLWLRLGIRLYFLTLLEKNRRIKNVSFLTIMAAEHTPFTDLIVWAGVRMIICLWVLCVYAKNTQY